MARAKIRTLLCICGHHRYGPDEHAGYPYQRCRDCEKMGIYRPSGSWAVVHRYL